MKKGFIVCFILLIITTFTFGASDFDKAIENAKNYYNQGDFTKAIQELEKAINSLEKQKDEDMIEAYKYLGFSYVAFGEKEKAKVEFKKVIKLDPQLKLDPAFVSPKIIAVFEEARAELMAEGFDFTKTPTPTPSPQSRPVPGGITKGGAFVRSLFIPGLGQIYKGQKTKGYLFLGTEILFLAGTLGAIGEYNDSKSAYEDAKMGDDFEKLYSEYEDAGSKANMFAMLTTLLWTYNIIDASFIGWNTSGYSISLNNDSNYIGLKFQYNF